MPWCEPCGKFYSPNTLHPDGTCPENHQVADAPSVEPSTVTTAPAADVSAKVPWHLWLLAIGVVVYLGWRLIQLVVWLVT